MYNINGVYKNHTKTDLNNKNNVPKLREFQICMFVHLILKKKKDTHPFRNYKAQDGNSDLIL